MYVGQAQEIEKQTGIPASITLAQMIKESSGKYNGMSGLAANGNNFFGVKGTGTAGSLHMLTSEYSNGAYHPVYADFKKYATPMDSLLDHAKLLLNNRYATYFKNATSVNDFAWGLQKGGYATDPKYAEGLINIIGQYNLSKYDSGKYKFTPNNFAGESTAASTPSDNTTLLGAIIRTLFLLLLIVFGGLFLYGAFPVSLPNIPIPI
jgi:flagellar protein FlgJ